MDYHVDGRSLRLQTATTTRLSSGWSWRMAQVVPPQDEAAALEAEGGVEMEGENKIFLDKSYIPEDRIFAVVV
jgi:hypothetical protein